MSQRLDLLELGSLQGDPLDLLICSASFEERCLSIPEALPQNGVGRALVFSTNSRTTAGAANLRRIRRRFGDRATTVNTTRDDPFSFADATRAALRKAAVGDSPRRILLDITTFTHEHLLILLVILREEMRAGDRVAIGYATAGDYTVSGGAWLSRGYSDVRSVLGYPGRMRPSRGEHLIVLFGYETERAERLIRTYEPAHLSLGHCEELGAIAPHLHTRNLELHSVVAQARQQVDFFEFGCDDPFTSRDHILREAQRLPDYNVVVAPMNTKLSTVGAALAAFADPGIQLCYLPVREYNEEGYSTAGGHCYLYDLDLRS